MREKVRLADKFALFTETWSPRIVGETNGQYVKLAKLDGEFVWHAHDDEDELFLVVSGHLDLHLRDRTISLDPGELFVVPKGVEHLPEASPGTEVLLIEPKSTAHTGDVVDERTVAVEDQVWI